ncbi:MAG TPA: CheR family methyltransferase [Solirubrobacteraceae bacterium]|jgi:chemotaxis protein methyltransferase CheR
MNAELSSVAELVEAETGIQIKAPQLISLAAALGRISPGMNAERFLAALSDSAEARTLLGQLIDQVAIQETYFMREPRELEAIDWRALLSAAHARGDPDVRVWVCACASGEEAYSVAMLAIESFGHDRPPVSILATDISQRALHRAQEALYTERSTREIDASRRERFFIERDRKSAVGEQLRSMVRFRRHNLVADPAPPLGEVPFDLVLCRNVLIYFGAANVEVVVKSLESALRPGGQLILGASDRLTSSARRFADLAARGRPAKRSALSGASKKQPEGRPRLPRKPIGTTGRKGSSAAASPASRRRTVSDAQAAANVGDYAEAIGITSEILAVDPLDAEAYFVRGLAELAAEQPISAAESLRRALYIDPSFALAAFQLGRAQDICGDSRAALRAYRRALSTLDPEDERYPHLLERVNAGDIAAACRARLGERRAVG